MRALLLATVTACWTGAAPAPAPAAATAPRRAFEISLARTMCFGNCPVYKLEIHADGRFEWTGEKFVHVTGTRTGELGGDDLAAIDEAITSSQFFKRDDYGELHDRAACTRSVNSMSCSWKGDVICSDTSHTILTIQRGARSHTIDNAHCTQDDSLTSLENELVERTHIGGWIGN